MQGFDTLAHDAQLAHHLGVGFGDGLGVREHMRQAFKGCADGLAKAVDQPLHQGARGLDGDLLAQDDTHGAFKTVHHAGQARAGAQGHRQQGHHGVDQ